MTAWYSGDAIRALKFESSGSSLIADITSMTTGSPLVSGNSLTVGKTAKITDTEDVEVETVRLSNEHERFIGGYGHLTRLNGDQIELNSIGFFKNTCWFGAADLTESESIDTENTTLP